MIGVDPPVANGAIHPAPRRSGGPGRSTSSSAASCCTARLVRRDLGAFYTRCGWTVHAPGEPFALDRIALPFRLGTGEDQCMSPRWSPATDQPQQRGGLRQAAHAGALHVTTKWLALMVVPLSQGRRRAGPSSGKAGQPDHGDHSPAGDAHRPRRVVDGQPVVGRHARLLDRSSDVVVPELVPRAGQEAGSVPDGYGTGAVDGMRLGRGLAASVCQDAPGLVVRGTSPRCSPKATGSSASVDTGSSRRHLS